MNSANDVVFLLDVDNTLLDNDRVQEDLRTHLEQAFGAASRDRYWTIFESLRDNWAMRTTWARCSATGTAR